MHLENWFVPKQTHKWQQKDTKNATTSSCYSAGISKGTRYGTWHQNSLFVVKCESQKQSECIWVPFLKVNVMFSSWFCACQRKQNICTQLRGVHSQWVPQNNCNLVKLAQSQLFQWFVECDATVSNPPIHAVGDCLVYYQSFDTGSGYELEGNAMLMNNGKVTAGISHLWIRLSAYLFLTFRVEHCCIGFVFCRLARL